MPSTDRKVDVPKRKTPEEKPEDQFKRFVETAEKIGVDDKEVDRAFRKLTRQEKTKADRKS